MRSELTRSGPDPSWVSSVRLSRGPCLGSCPIYRVTLSTSGDVGYLGEMFADRQGWHKGRVEPDMVRALITDIVDLGFLELRPEYPDPDSGEGVDCVASCELELRGDDRSHRVIDHSAGMFAPPEVEKAARLVDVVVERHVRWSGRGSRRSVGE